MHNVELVFLSHGLHHVWTPIYILAKSNIDIEQLKSQVESLSKEKEIAESVIKYCFAFVGVVIAALAAFFKFSYGSSLKEVEQTINSQVVKEVSRQIKESVSGRITTLEQIIDREDIIKKVSVGYFNLANTQNNEEIKLLKGRRFKVEALNGNSEGVSLDNNIFVLDLFNSMYTKEEKEKLVQKMGQRIANQTIERPVLVIYVDEHLQEIKKIPGNVYYLAANSKATLVGAVVNAANTSEAIRGIT